MISIILPTYNEAANMALIIPALSEMLRQHTLTGEILVMDDNSPDGTADAARALADKHPVRVVVRTKNKGLSASVIDGFKEARGDIVLVMDADMSHPIDRVPAMIAPIRAGEVAITVGSRYIPGGGCEDWSTLRQIISRGAGLLARGITPLADPTSGFMAVRKNIVENLELDPVGWKIVLETVIRSGAPVREIPILFKDREHGESKLTATVQLQYLLHLWRLYGFRLPNFMQFVRFCLVGLSGVFVDTGVLVLAVEIFEESKILASALSFLAAVSWNFFLNQSWTFKAHRPDTALQRFLSFLAVCSGGMAIKVGVVALLITYLGFGSGFWYVAANLIGIAFSTTVNFFGSRYLVFKVEKL